ncbi:MAG: FAD-dependent oxidoreductase [Pseudomonadota bacterium]
MTGTAQTADVIVLGAGVAGLAAARALAERGGVKVLVVEMEATYACGSTTKAAGSIRRQLHTETLTRIADQTTRDLLTFEQRYGVNPDCEIPGYLNLASSAASHEKLLREDAIHRKVGFKTEILTPDEIGKRWGFIRTDDLAGGTLAPDDLNLDPFQVAAGLYRGARGGGAVFMFNTRVTGIIRGKGGAAAGVETTRGEIHAPAVVNAAGPWAAELCVAAGMAETPPLRPRRRLMWQIGKGIRIPRQIPFMVDLDAPFYLRPFRELFLLSLMEEDEVELLGNDPPFEWSWLFKVEDRVAGRMPGLLEGSIARGWAGWRTLTPDDMPVLGRVEQVPGFYMAAGFGGHGIALAPFCGELTASAVLGDGKYEAELEELSLSRFQRLSGSAGV